MAATLKPISLVLSVAIFVCGLPSAYGQQKPPEAYLSPMTGTYSQKTLLKNWALSVCLAAVAKDAGDREDANATASAYLEFGRQRIEAYDAVRELALEYASRNYSGSIKSGFNTMKCIDLFHSKKLDGLVTRLVRQG